MDYIKYKENGVEFCDLPPDRQNWIIQRTCPVSHHLVAEIKSCICGHTSYRYESLESDDMVDWFSELCQAEDCKNGVDFMYDGTFNLLRINGSCWYGSGGHHGCDTVDVRFKICYEWLEKDYYEDLEEYSNDCKGLWETTEGLCL